MEGFLEAGAYKRNSSMASGCWEVNYILMWIFCLWVWVPFSFWECSIAKPIVGPKEANNTQWKNKDGLFSIYAYMWSSAILLYLLHLFVSLSALVFTSQNFLGQMFRDDKIDLDSMLNIIHVLDNGFLSEEVEDSDRVSDQTTEMKKSVFTLDKIDFGQTPTRWFWLKLEIYCAIEEEK